MVFGELEVVEAIVSSSFTVKHNCFKGNVGSVAEMDEAHMGLLRSLHIILKRTELWFLRAFLYTLGLKRLVRQPASCGRI